MLVKPTTLPDDCYIHVVSQGDLMHIVCLGLGGVIGVSAEQEAADPVTPFV
jgi:hypothetical protein